MTRARDKGLRRRKIPGSGGGGAIVLPTDSLIFEGYSDLGITEDGFGVTLWEDQHTSSNDLSQTADSRKPPTVTDALDGYPAIHFDGTAVNLNRATLTGGARGAESTVYLVAALDDTIANPGVMCGNTDASTTYRIQHNTTTWGVFQGSLVGETAGTADTNWHQFCATFGASDTLFVDGAEKLSGNAGTTAADGICIGRGSAGAVFKATALFVYSKTHSTSEREQVQAYIKARYPSLPAVA